MKTTVKEVVQTVLEKMSGSDKLRLQNTKEDNLILYHHGFGTQIRNNFGLWSGNPALLIDAGFAPNAHADEVSMKIIKAIWEELQNAEDL